MSLPTTISGENNEKAKVTAAGQLITAPLEYSTISFNTLAVIDTAYTFATPIGGKEGVITDIIIATDRNVGASGSLIEIYLADSPTSTVIASNILTIEMTKNSTMVMNGLNWKFPAGKWLNAKCNDNNVYLTITGYYINE
jgi:hypothetical protein